MNPNTKPALITADTSKKAEIIPERYQYHILISPNVSGLLFGLRIMT
jgi:hypothetical protein